MSRSRRAWSLAPSLALANLWTSYGPSGDWAMTLATALVERALRWADLGLGDLTATTSPTLAGNASASGRSD